MNKNIDYKKILLEKAKQSYKNLINFINGNNNIYYLKKVDYVNEIITIKIFSMENNQLINKILFDKNLKCYE